MLAEILGRADILFREVADLVNHFRGGYRGRGGPPGAQRLVTPLASAEGKDPGIAPLWRQLEKRTSRSARFPESEQHTEEDPPGPGGLGAGDGVGPLQLLPKVYIFVTLFGWAIINFKRTTLGKHFILALIIGILIGFTVAYIILSPSEYLWQQLSDPHTSSQMEGISGPLSDPGTHSKDEVFHRMEDSSVADHLAEQVRILCWVMTGPKNHDRRARHVKNTWGKRCNVILFMSSKEDKTLPAVALPVKEGRNNLWGKTKEAFKYVYEHYLQEADWFLKADDDTYIVLENLRYMLMTYNPAEPVYFGCRFKPFVKQGYMSGGAGYVLSKEALKRFIEVGLPNSTLCSSSVDGNEDVEMGRCMESVRVKAGDSRDALGRGRFFPFVPEHHLIPGHVSRDFWYWKYIYYDSKEGMDCCSDNAVSFHYVSPNQMYVLEYLIYHLRPYGISYQVEMPMSVSQQPPFFTNIERNLVTTT